MKLVARQSKVLKAACSSDACKRSLTVLLLRVTFGMCASCKGVLFIYQALV